MSSRHGRSVAILLASLAAIAAPTGCSHLVILHDPLTGYEHGDLGVAYETAGQPALAAREYRRSLKLNPRQSRTRVNLGNVQAALGHWQAAEKSFRRALRDSATNTDAMNNLAVALVRQGRNRGEARALAERAVAMAGPSDSVYRATLVEVNADQHPHETNTKQGR